MWGLNAQFNVAKIGVDVAPDDAEFSEETAQSFLFSRNMLVKS